MKVFRNRRLMTVTPVLFLALILFGANGLAMAQENSVALFGPREFLRSSGKPMVEEFQFSINGYAPPFVLHVLNGDENGKNRVSSAWIWLNNQPILAPSDFNQQVSRHDFEVSLTDDPSTIKVRVAAAPGGKLTVWIGGVANPNIKQVGPEGGLLEFPNGIILDIPPGAVAAEVGIEVTDLSCESVDVLLADQIGTYEKRCLRAFSAKPDGLVFNLPIKAIVPVTLEPGEIPVLMQLDQQDYLITEGELLYRGTDGVVEISLLHFSEKHLAALMNHINKTCKSYETYMADLCGGHLDEPNKWFDNLQPGACWFSEAERKAKGFQDVKCCMEELIEVKVTDVDFTSRECQIIGSSVSVTFLACEGAPTQSHSDGATAGCPKDMTLEIDISSSPPWIYECEEALLEAWATGKGADGTLFFELLPFPAKWDLAGPASSLAELGEEIPPNKKVVKGLKAGDVIIHASTAGSNPQYGDYTLSIKELILKIHPGDDQQIFVDDSIELWVPCVDCPQGITWSAAPAGIVTLTSLPGDAVGVTGIARGTATIFARSYDYCGEVIEDSVTVEVTNFRIIPSSTVLILGNNTKTLRCELTDGSGNFVDISPPATVTWTSESSGVSLSSTTGLEIDVTPNDEGPATITATYTGPYGQKTATAIVRVRSFQGSWDTYFEGYAIDWTPHIFYCPMGITVDGTTATGNYRTYTLNWGWVNGQLSGVISEDGYEFAGEYLDEGIGNLPPTSGTFSFQLAPDGNSFTGYYTNFANEEVHNLWYGNRR